MKTLKQLDKHLQYQEGGNNHYYMGYKDAIEGIYKDIMDSELINVYTIEKYLKDLLNK